MNLQNLIMFMSVISMISAISSTLIVGTDTVLSTGEEVALSSWSTVCSLQSTKVSSYDDWNLPVDLADDSVISQM